MVPRILAVNEARGADTPGGSKNVAKVVIPNKAKTKTKKKAIAKKRPKAASSSSTNRRVLVG